MADVQHSGLRRRYKNGEEQGEVSPGDEGAGYGYVDSGEEGDERFPGESTAHDNKKQHPMRGVEAEAEDDGATADEEDNGGGEDEEDSEYGDDEEDDDSELDLRDNLVPIPKHLLDAPKEDDTFVLVAGAVGFFLALLCSAMLPTFGIEQDYVMAGGMLALLTYVLWVSMCPSCRKAPVRHLSPVESVTPQAVFIVAACIGTMMGGLIGGGVKHMWPQDAFRGR